MAWSAFSARVVHIIDGFVELLQGRCQFRLCVSGDHVGFVFKGMDGAFHLFADLVYGLEFLLAETFLGFGDLAWTHEGPGVFDVQENAGFS